MDDLLLVIAVLLPCWYGYRRSVSRGLVEINHVTTLTFGFLFYWITPLAVRVWASQVEFPLSSAWFAFFRARLIAPYALSCIALYLCLVLGDTVGIFVFREGEHKAVTTVVPKPALSVVTLAACALMVYSGFVFRAALFKRATPTSLEVGVARGAVTACIILLGAVAIIFTLDHPEIPWRKRLFTPHFVALIAGGGMMVILGSRLYVASLLVMFVIYQTNFRARYKLKTVVAASIVFAFLFGAVGTWREGSSVTGAFFNVLLEPMEDSLSLVHHLRYKGIAWLNAPTQLASDFENLIPTVLMPNKLYEMKKPDAYRPLGGLHSFVSFNLNFGILGSALFWFLWPMGFRYLKSRSSSTLFATIYIMCSGWLTFTFFRDPFSISLVKCIFEDSILVPFVIVGFGRLLSTACSPAGNTIVLTLPPQPDSS